MKEQLPTSLTSPFPPAIVETSSGRYLLADKWYPIDGTFTLEDAHRLWKRKPIAPPAAVVFHRVPSSDGKKFYTVQNGPSGWSCTCTGFGFRRDCKHVQSVKKAV